MTEYNQRVTATQNDMVTPVYDHDCSECVFLGRSLDGYADLYFCSKYAPSVIARYGSLGHQYTSGMYFLSVSPWLGQAASLARERGLL